MSGSDNLYFRDGVWYGRVQIRGRDRKKSLHTDDEQKAKRRLKAWLKQENDQAFDGPRHSWFAAVVRFKAETMPDAVKASTAKRYVVSLRQLDLFLGKRSLHEINRAMISDIIGERKRAGTTNATIKRDLTALSRVLGAAVGWGWIEANPLKVFDRSGVRERRDAITPPTDAMVEKMIAACPANFGRCVRFLAQTGMRQQEAVFLEWSQVDLDRKAVQLTKTKTGRPRFVPLTDEAAGTLTGTARHGSEPYVFWHGDGKPYRNFASRFRVISKRAKAVFRCHDLRHKFAIDYLRDGGDIYKLSRILGHSSVKTTEIYLGYVVPSAGPV